MSTHSTHTQPDLVWHSGRPCLFLLGASLLTAILIAISPAAAADNPNLVAAYSFDQGTGTILADDSGHGKTGVMTNGVWTTGKFGKALSFDGTAFVNIGDFSSVMAPYTVEFWFAASALPSSGTYKLFGQAGCCALSPAVLLEGGQLTFQTGDDKFVYASTVLTSLDLNHWHHVAFVVDSNASLANWKVYVDGIDVTGRKGRNTGTFSNFGNTTSIGGNDQYSGFKNYQGQIDELRIYKVALTSAQVQADMATPISAIPAPPPSPAPTLALSVAPASIAAGAAATLTWSSTNATGCAASGAWSGSVATTGSQTVSPALTSTYALACSGSGGSASSSVTVAVTPPPPPVPQDLFHTSTFATTFNSPTAMEFAPDGRLFVLEKSGSVRIVKNGLLLPTPFVTVPAVSDNEHGLLGIAFDPGFDSNHYVFLYYTRPTVPPTNGVSRFTANGDVAVPGSELSILNQDDSGGGAHNGGAIHFGLDGKLYVAVGAYRSQDSQDLTRDMGKMLRINSDGTIPPDNPFVSTPGIRPEIWAYGFRNPYTFAVDPATGAIYVNDVGESTWEEVNLLIKGANYGWPLCEGPIGTGVGSCTSSSLIYPLYAYPHNNASSAITGGAFNRAGQFPSTYAGSYFFGDYAAGFIRRLDIDNTPLDFAGLSSAGAINGPVDLKIGPDGALYYLSINLGAVYRVAYYTATANVPPTAAISAVPASGPSPLTVSFSGSKSTDANGDLLSYSWDFGDNVVDSGINVKHTYVIAGSYTAKLTVDDAHGGSDSATMLIMAGSPPTPVIAAPPSGTFYDAGDVIAYSGTATDMKDGALSASAFSWTIVFHHDTHTHPFLGPITGIKAGTFQVPMTGEVSASTWYRIHLTVTNSDGLSTEVTRDVFPLKANFTLTTNVAGLLLTLDGQPLPTPSATQGVVNFTRNIGAPSPQTVNGQTYVFSSWSDGGAATHSIQTPSADTTYTATYLIAAPPTLTFSATPAVIAVGTSATLSWSSSDSTNCTASGAWTGAAATSGSLAVSPTVTSAYVLTCSGNGLSTSQSVTVTVLPPPTITTQPQNITAVAGSNVAFSVVAGGAPPLAYQWRKGGSSIAGATAATLTLNNVQMLDAGTYDVMVSNVSGVVASKPATLGVNPLPRPAPPTGVTAAAGTAQVVVTWAAVAGATSYNVKRATVSGGPYANVANVTVTSYTNTGLVNGTTYYYVVSAVSAGGEGNNSAPASATPVANGLLSPWQTRDIGAVSVAGNATSSGSAFVVSGSGADIGGTNDAFRFVYQTASGDCEIRARVASMGNTNPWAKAGIMIRETLTANSRHVSAFVTPGNGVAFQRRSTTGANSSQTNTTGPTAPYWVRVVRAGNTFTVYRSANGTSWTSMGSVRIVMGTSVYIGMAVTSRRNGTVNTATFDSVTATP